MKKNVLLLVLVVLVVSLIGCQSKSVQETTSVSEEPQELLVAKVGDTQITKEYYAKAYKVLAYNIKKIYGDDIMDQDYGEQKIRDVMRENLLNEMVAEVIKREYLEAKNVTVTAEEIQEDYNKYMESLKDDPDQMAFHDENGIDEDSIKKNIENQLYNDKFVAEITENVEKTLDFEGEAFLNRVAKAHALHILVESEEEAQSIIEKLNAGEDFAELAKTFSVDKVSGEKGGDLGYFSVGQMVKPFEEAAFSTEIGQISQPVKTEFGYHIIKVLDKMVVKQLLETEDGKANVQDLKDKILKMSVNDAYYAKIDELKLKYEIETFIDNTIIEEAKDESNAETEETTAETKAE